MRFVLLRYDYLTDHPTIEAMAKNRPHAIVLIDVEGLRFAIPLRTHLKHRQGFKTINQAGLDFSKALLIFEPRDISRDIKLESSEEFSKIVDSESIIIKKFTKYVENYISAVRKGNTSELDRDYRYSTLVNYHRQLNI